MQNQTLPAGNNVMSNFELIITDSYRKKEKDFLKHHRDIVDAYAKTMSLLSVNPFYPSLRLHKLQGKLRSYYSVSITMQYRIVIDFMIEDNKLIPLNVGDHEIYR